MSGETDIVRLTRAQVREVDRLATEQYHIPGIVLMENAARAVTDVVTPCVAHSGRNEVLVLCGGGNNGGDGLAVARHLHNRGVQVSIGLFANPEQFRGDALANWRIVRAMGLETFPLTIDRLMEFGGGVVVDAIFGTGLSRPPTREFEETASALYAAAPSDIVAVDVPSGLDCDTGEPLGACVWASRTVTFVAEKAGFANPAARQYLGQVTVGDIGAPCELLDAVRRT
jgi:NAD(P)H-hydrate epimerase